MAATLRSTGVDGEPTLLGLPLTAAWFGVWCALLPAVTVTLAVRVEEIAPDAKISVLSLVLATGAAVALVAQNVAALLSDRTTSRSGRRRPWLAVGVLVGAASLAGVAVCSGRRRSQVCSAPP